MESIFFLCSQETISCALILITIVCFYIVRNRKKNGVKAPVPAGSWPLIGHLHFLLRPDQLPHRALAAMADKYGPAFFIRLGFHRTLVVSNWEVAKECFITNDEAFASRPKSAAMKYMGYEHAVLGFTPYGPYWRNVRKITVSHLLSSIRLGHLKHVRDSETNQFVGQLLLKFEENQKTVLVDIKEMFGYLAMNIILRKVVGRRYTGNDQEARRCQKVLRNYSRLQGMFFVSDWVPILGWVDVLKGNIGEMKRNAKELDSVFGKWVDEHRERRLAGEIQETEKDFMHVMLSVLDDGQASAQDVDTVIKATCLSIISGANDTTIVTLTWTISLLLNHRNVLKKVQEELDIHVGKHRRVDETDIKNLTYLQAVVKETLRLRPAAPLIPRESIRESTVAGFRVSKGTHLLVNLSKVQTDPTVWTNPLEFVPERFLEKQEKIDVKGTRDFEFIPFGSGRRVCPGASFGLQVIHLTLARLLHTFEIWTVSDKPVDMSEGPGLIPPKATPLEVVITPRVSKELYVK